MKKVIGCQGEITILQVDKLPEGLKEHNERTEKGVIVSHSESGNHHLLVGDVKVMEREKVPEGMKILTAIVRGEATLEQDAAVPHEKYVLQEGLYEFRLAREYNPFLEQARRVAD